MNINEVVRVIRGEKGIFLSPSVSGRLSAYRSLSLFEVGWLLYKMLLSVLFLRESYF